MIKNSIKILFVLLSLSGFAQVNEVEIDFTTQKFIGNESELNRAKYFAMHDSYTSWDLASDGEYLYNNLGIEYAIYNFIINNNIDYKIIDKMDLIWFPTNHQPINM